MLACNELRKVRQNLLLGNIGPEIEEIVGEDPGPDHIDAVYIRYSRSALQKLAIGCQLLCCCLGCGKEVHSNSSLPFEQGEFAVEATLIVPAHPRLIHQSKSLHRSRRAGLVAGLRHKNEEANPAVRNATNSAQPRSRRMNFASSARVRHKQPRLASIPSPDDSPERSSVKNDDPIEAKDAFLNLQSLILINTRQYCSARHLC